jgi:hypothetical protein
MANFNEFLDQILTDVLFDLKREQETQKKAEAESKVPDEKDTAQNTASLAEKAAEVIGEEDCANMRKVSSGLFYTYVILRETGFSAEQAFDLTKSFLTNNTKNNK